MGTFASCPILNFLLCIGMPPTTKHTGRLFFANPDDKPADIIGKTILTSCNVNGNFDPVPWGIPNIRTQPYDPELDHDWYEFESVTKSEEPPTDGRPLQAFLEAVIGNLLL